MTKSSRNEIQLADEEMRRVGLISRVSTMVSMPYRSKHLQRITRRNGSLTLVIQSNTDEIASGIYPRKFELYLLNQIASHDPSWDGETCTLHLGGSFRQFMKSIGSTIGGRQAKTLRIQMERLWKSTFSITDTSDSDYSRGVQFVVARTMSAYWGQHDDDETLDQSWVTFSPEYIAMLTRRTVPVDLDIVARINSPMALDIYWWAARRLFTATSPIVVTWEQLREQFGSDAEQMKRFRQTFRESFKEVQKFWPDLTMRVRRPRYGRETVIISAVTHVVPTKAEQREEERLRSGAEKAAAEARIMAEIAAKKKELEEAIKRDEEKAARTLAAGDAAPRIRTTTSHFIGSSAYDPDAAAAEAERFTIQTLPGMDDADADTWRTAAGGELR